jgi:hypothetical protein
MVILVSVLAMMVTVQGIPVDPTEVDVVPAWQRMSSTVELTPKDLLLLSPDILSQLTNVSLVGAGINTQRLHRVIGFAREAGSGLVELRTSEGDVLVVTNSTESGMEWWMMEGEDTTSRRSGGEHVGEHVPRPPHNFRAICVSIPPGSRAGWPWGTRAPSMVSPHTSPTPLPTTSPTSPPFVSVH